MNAGFVDLSTDYRELLAMLRETNLAGANENPGIQPLTGGVSSTILRVCLRRGDVCVKQALPTLKVERAWHAPTERVLAEIAWITTVAQFCPDNVPRILASDVPRRAFVMAYLPPSRYANWKSDLLGGRVHSAIGKQVGELLGKVHQRTADSAELAGRFSNDEQFFALRLEPYFIETSRQHPDLKGRLLEITRAVQANKLALVHGDVSPKNILIGSEGPVLLDAECACYSDPAFDLAFLLTHILLKAVHLPGESTLFTALFDSVLLSYSSLITWESPRAFEARVAALVPALMLARVDGKSPVEYLSSDTRVALRSTARRLLKDTPTALAEESPSIIARMCARPEQD
jgi:aminoglycoside phosphotransferase (APT) family kinase protein